MGTITLAGSPVGNEENVMTGFSRTQTQILFRHVPGAIFEHDRYGICRVTDIMVSAASTLNTDALRYTVRTVLEQWQDSGSDAFPDPDTEWDEYRVGIPERVLFEPYPPVLECRACGTITTLDTLAGLSLNTPARCQRCGRDSYRQLPYVMAHGCGRLAPIFVPPCPVHGRTDVRFNDTGRFVTASWSCGICRTFISRMTQRPCGCAFGRRVPSQSNMRYLRTNDTAVLYSHTSTFVNLNAQLLDTLRDDPRPTGLLLARLWGLIEEPAPNIAAERQRENQRSRGTDQERELIAQLLRENPTSTAAQQLAARLGLQGRLTGDDAIDQVATRVAGVEQRPSRGLIEAVAIQDTLDSITTDQAWQSAEERGDSAGAYDVEEGVRLAQTTLGIESIRCLTNFPLAIAAVGYSRVDNRRNEALIQPFPRTQSEGSRIPIYVLPSISEALLVRLSPRWVARWLIANGLANGPIPTPGVESWTWIRRQLPDLAEPITTWSRRDSPSSGAAAATITLLHTISHVLLRQIEWSGFDPESVGEYLLPEALGIIIHTNNYRSFVIGGMVTMFEQRLLGWLSDSFNAAFSCVYNPICADEGGSCSGCLHRQHNCELFNGMLSRSVLTGGSVPNLGMIDVGAWSMIDDGDTA